MAESNLTRWTVSVPKETDISLRCFLAEHGMKKGDMSKFIVDAVKWRILDQTVSEIRKQFADMSQDELQSLVDEATESVRAEMCEEFRKQEA